MGSDGWKSLAIDFGDWALHGATPAFESTDLPRRTVDLRVDPLDAGIYERGRAVVLEKYWDFPAGFLKGVAGTLEFTVALIQSPAGQQPISIEGLQATIEAWQQGAYGRRDGSGTSRQQHLLPERYERVDLGGREGLRYRFGHGGIRAYALPLHPACFLQLQFIYVDNDRGLGTRWQEKARVMEDDIVRQVRLTDNTLRPSAK